jgi:hypothetical protein
LNITWYLGAAVVALACTAAYLFIPRRRVPVTGTVAFLLWGFCALQGYEVYKYDNTGASVRVPFPDPLRWIMFALAILSLLAVVLWALGVYPPELEGEGTEGDSRYQFGD